MTRTLPPRMAAIPETLVVNNRMVSSSNLNTVPTNLRGSSFLNETNTNTLRSRAENVTGYETDSGMNIRQQNHIRRQVPVDIQYGDSGWVGKQSMSRPVSQQQQQQQQQQRFVDNNQYYRSQDQLRSTSIPVFNQDPSATTSRLPEQHVSITNKTQQKRIPNVNHDRVDNQTITIKTPSTPTFPVTNQSFNQNIQTRIGNNSFRNQEENSRRSSVSSATGKI
jgi:hypothetical protein